jgi:hypothetical protein
MNSGMFPLPSLSLAQCFGILAFGIVLWSFSQKDDRRLIYGQIVSSAFWIIHYVMMAQPAATALCAVHLLRYGSAPFVRPRAAWHLPSTILIVLLYLAAGFAFYQNPMDLFAIFASSLAGYALLMLRGIRMRLVFLIVSSGWFIFNLYAGSIGGILCDLSVLTVNAATIWRMHKTTRPV